MSPPHVLILDNSPRRLGTRWFGKWFKQGGYRVTAHNFWHKATAIALDNFDALLISGSPASAKQDDPWILQELDLIEQADERSMPVLGVCFGAQLLARAYYGKTAVRPSVTPEIGWYQVSQNQLNDRLFAAVPQHFTSFQFHLEDVVPQPGMQILASSGSVELQAFRIDKKPVWGTQFHLEVTPRAGYDFLRKTQHVYEPYGFNYDTLIAQARPSTVAPQIFSNFVGAFQKEGIR